MISTHAPRAGSDFCGQIKIVKGWNFNPRSPCGERRGISQATERTREFQPTLPVRGATRDSTAPLGHSPISTHAPRAGSDLTRPPKWRMQQKFQPTLPVRGATPTTFPRLTSGIFQPTLPVRGATIRFRGSRAGSQFQPTLPVRGATLSHHDAKHIPHISTHAPRAGSDMWLTRWSVSTTFQPTLPVRGATQSMGLSIVSPPYFNPRSPCGERLPHFFYDSDLLHISTHAPRAGSD